MRFIRIALCALLVPGTAAAQSVADIVWYDLKHGFGDMFHMATSPIHGSVDDWMKFGIVMGGSAAFLPIDDDLDQWIVDHEGTALLEATKPFRKGPIKHLGSGSIATRWSAITWGAGVLTSAVGQEPWGRTLRDAGMGCVASVQTSALFRHFLYEYVSRERPLIAEGDQYTFDVPGGEHDYHSFFGGHGANAMACATLIAERFDIGGWGEVAMYTVATGVGLGRVAERKHWVSDAVLGAAFGYAIGKTVAARSRGRARASGIPGAVDGPTDDADHDHLSRIFIVPAGDRMKVGYELKF